MAGVFLSADALAGNGAGMNPYAYVGGNPETWSDPSGLAAVSSCFATCGGSEHYPARPVSSSQTWITSVLVGLVTTGNVATPPPPPQTTPWGRDLSSGLSGACLTAGCQANILAETGSSPVQGPSIVTCVGLAFGPCVPVMQPTAYLHENPPLEMTYCTPPYGCGGGDSSASDSESARVNDLLFLSDTAEEFGPPTIDPGLLQPGEAQAAGQADAEANAGSIPSDYWRSSSLNNAPMQTSPGVRRLSGTHINDLGMEEPYVAYYDEYGRIVGRTDSALGDASQGIDPIHSHIYSYNEFSRGFAYGAMPFGDHIPGELDPLFKYIGWEFLL